MGVEVDHLDARPPDARRAASRLQPRTMAGVPDTAASAAYARTSELIAGGRPVVLDGAVGTELPRVGATGGRPRGRRPRGPPARVGTPPPAPAAPPPRGPARAAAV